MSKIISPTGKGIRNDSAGGGYYGASRGNRIHKGLDFLCTPGQRVYCPIDNGRVVRLAYPYADQQNEGVIIQNDQFEIALFYFTPHRPLPSEPLAQGTPIGTAEDITLRYAPTSMQPHLHLEIKSMDPTLFIGDLS